VTHVFTIDPTLHEDYGLAYPVTYQFTFPEGTQGLKVYRRFRETGS
jgi:hypothetical protein